jgi:hypothetical protein
LADVLHVDDPKRCVWASGNDVRACPQSLKSFDVPTGVGKPFCDLQLDDFAEKAPKALVPGDEIGLAAIARLNLLDTVR